MKFQGKARILANRPLQGAYFRLDLVAPAIAPAAQPGQFVHLRVPLLEHRVLRRPFSIFDVEPVRGSLSLIYKVIGEGTAHLAELKTGVEADLLGPLGRGYSLPALGSRPVIVAGGYGCAATYLLARRSPVPCLCLFGARTAAELLLIDEFAALGCEVRIATDDGSQGHRGMVTELLEEALASPGPTPTVYACGPNPMLQAVSRLVQQRGLDAEISLDHTMCCGVGACFACVVKQKAETPDGWDYVRTCTDGPVFKASQTVWS